MFKKILFLIIFIVALANPQQGFAQEESTAAATAKPVEYMLPYPGLLPDHSFYQVKLWRDMVITYFTSGPLRKGALHLQQADKHIQAVYMLVMQKKGRMDLVEETLQKANASFEQAITKANEAKEQGLDNADLVKQLTLAPPKYHEIIAELEKEVKKEDKKLFIAEQKKLDELEKKVKQIRQ